MPRPAPVITATWPSSLNRSKIPIGPPLAATDRKSRVLEPVSIIEDSRANLAAARPATHTDPEGEARPSGTRAGIAVNDDRKKRDDRKNRGLQALIRLIRPGIAVAAAGAA